MWISDLTGPKDLPIIARAGGRLFGRAIGYINMARGHLDGVMKQPQMQEVWLFLHQHCFISTSLL